MKKVTSLSQLQNQFILSQQRIIQQLKSSCSMYQARISKITQQVSILKHDNHLKQLQIQELSRGIKQQRICNCKNVNGKNVLKYKQKYKNLKKQYRFKQQQVYKLHERIKKLQYQNRQQQLIMKKKMQIEQLQKRKVFIQEKQIQQQKLKTRFKIQRQKQEIQKTRKFEALKDLILRLQQRLLKQQTNNQDFFKQNKQLTEHIQKLQAKLIQKQTQKHNYQKANQDIRQTMKKKLTKIFHKLKNLEEENLILKQKYSEINHYKKYQKQNHQQNRQKQFIQTPSEFKQNKQGQSFMNRHQKYKLYSSQSFGIEEHKRNGGLNNVQIIQINQRN